MGLFSTIGAIAQMGQSNKAHDIYGQALGAGYNAVQQGLTDSESRIRPTAQIGTDTITNLSNIINNGDMSKFYDNPSYKYALEQAQRGIQANAAAKGSLMSGNTLKELQKNASGLASQNYGSYIQNLQNLFSETSPYLSSYNAIPNQRGQNTMNYETAMGQNSYNAHMDKGNQLTGIGSGFDSSINQAATAALGMPSMGGGGGSFMSNLFPQQQPQQYGDNYGFRGFQ